jgi:hypothetical protein
MNQSHLCCCSTALKLFDYDIAGIGMSFSQAKEIGMDVKEHTITANSYAGYYSAKKVTIKVSSRKIKGVQCIGSRNGCTKGELLRYCHVCRLKHR